VKKPTKAICVWVGIILFGNLVLWTIFFSLHDFHPKNISEELPDSLSAILALDLLFNLFMGAMLLLLLVWLVITGIQLALRGLKELRYKNR
jgi:hypothetical protein